MAKVRIIARLDIKGPNLIKGVQLEGLRVMGDPHEFARRYYEDGADELIYMDTVASLYGRNNLVEIVEQTARDVFVPITVGGGLRSTDDVRTILRAGADKVAINTAATKRPELVTEVARHFGSQCMVLGIEAKQKDAGRWVCYTDNGREATDLDVVEWAMRGVALGAGEILLTSVDREGTARGFDIEVVRAVTDAVPVPVIASGGMGCMEDFVAVVRDGGAFAAAAAHVLHYGEMTIPEIRTGAAGAGLDVRVP
jgi:cyclase